MDTEPKIISYFKWEDIPGNDSEILLDILNKKYGIDWATSPKIEKIDDYKIIKVTTDKNYVLLSLNNEKNEVQILIDNGRTIENKKWIAKTDNGKLKIYPSIYQSGIWKGAFMEGIWCGKGNWDPHGKWEGEGKWKSGKLDGGWKGEGKWSKDNGNEYEGKWKGKGTLWANNTKKLGSTFTIFTLLSIIGFVVSRISDRADILRLKDIPFYFVGATILVLFILLYLQKLKGKWWATGKWTKNQDDYILTLDENPKSKAYLFNWEDFPGNDNGRFIEFLKKNFGIYWAENAKIEKIDGDKIIKVSTEKNNISLKLNDEQIEVILYIDDIRTDKFDAKKEDNKLNIYSRKKWTIADLIGALKSIGGSQKSEAKWKIAGLKGTLEGTIEECKDYNDSEPTISLFCWDDIPGNDKNRLLEYLKKKYQVNWVDAFKLDTGKIIKVIADKNYVLLSLNKEETEVHILFDNVKTLKTEKWTAKNENGRLNIYLSNYQSGIWKGAFMEGIWCGTEKWYPPGKWEGRGQWHSDKLNGRWIGNGTWSEDKGNKYQGEWKGSGTLWEINQKKKLGSTFRLFTIISIIGSVLGAKFSMMTEILGLKDIPYMKDVFYIFLAAAILVLVIIMFILHLKGSWSATGKWIKNQKGDYVLTLSSGAWGIAGLTGTLEGTIEKCKSKCKDSKSEDSRETENWKERFILKISNYLTPWLK